MTKLLKILYISSRGDKGAGGENYLLTLFRNIDLNRFQPIVVLPKEGSLRKPLEDLGVEVILVQANYGWLKPDIAWYKALEGIQNRVKALSSLIDEKKIDIVHTNSNLRFEGALAARLTGIPHLYLAHIEYQPDMPIFQRLPFSQSSFSQLMGDLSDQIVAVSNSVANTLSSHVSADKLEVIHNGLELNYFDEALAIQPNAFRQELGLTDSDILITAVGRITYDKGFDYFVETARLIAGTFKKNIHFVIAGDTENTVFAEELKQKVHQYNLNDCFHFLGFREDIPNILAASDIFILSSRKEGHPYVMLEAMASKCAIVACNCAGVEETIEEAISGFIVPIGEIETIAQRIIEIINSPQLRHSLADAARKRIENAFTADKTANRLMHVYEAILTAPKKTAGSFSVELFLQSCTEIARLGRKNIELENRLQRVEHIADLIQNNPVSKNLRYIKNHLN